MIYSKPNLVVKILFESSQERPISGVFRPQVYMKATGKYCSVCRFNHFKKPIEKGRETVMDIIIEAPVGFGHHLEFAALLTISEGLDVVGQAVVLEVLGYVKDFEVKKKIKKDGRS